MDDAAARFVVIATQGRGDEAALQAALAIDAEYVAFVGSRKKAEALKAKFAASGRARTSRRSSRHRQVSISARSRLTRSRVSILAEIVAERRSKRLRELEEV